jgi:menaquinone-specific isochorismate synthase
MTQPLEPYIFSVQTRLQPVIETPQDSEFARKSLLEQVEYWLRSGQAPDTGKLVRLEVPFQGEDALRWLAQQQQQRKLYWSDRTQRRQIAGLGEAWALEAWQPDCCVAMFRELRTLLDSVHPAVRCFGGMRFDAKARTAPEWQDWPSARFVIPQIAVETEGGEATLVVNILRGTVSEEQSALLAIRQQLLALRFEECKTLVGIPGVERRVDHPDQQGWCAQVAYGLAAIRQGTLQKIVLARSAEFTLEQSVDPIHLLLHLRKQAPQAFHFCFQLAANHAFLGITPERLYCREQQRLESEALAGTRTRGLTMEEDVQLARELQESHKEQREHEMVLEYLEAMLPEFCLHSERLSHLEPLALRHVQHLRSRIRGTLRPGVSDAELLPAFHPTPAISGTPNEVALAYIRELESFDRGWYAGPVGWMSRDAAEFAVGLRAGLLTEQTLRVYTGAGIVEGSIPEDEWDEVESKMRTWLSLLKQA